MSAVHNGVDNAAQHAYWEDIFQFIGVDGFLVAYPHWTPCGWRLVMAFYSDEEHKGEIDG